MAKKMLSKVSYIPLDAETAPDLCRKYSVFSAPTLVVINSNNIEKYGNLSMIKRYADTH